MFCTLQVNMREFQSAETRLMMITINVPQREHLLMLHPEPTGVCSHLGRHWVGLFVIGQTLFLSRNGDGHAIGEQQIMAAWSQNGVARRLELRIDGSIIQLDYENDQLPTSTVFYSEDAEDVDFGLWLTNVLASDERKNIFVQSWQAG